MLFGVSSQAYWASWLLFVMIFDAIYAAIIVGAGNIFGYSLFTNCPLILMFAVFYVEILSYHCLAMTLSTLVADSKSGSKFGYGLMLVGLFIQIFFGNVQVLNLIYGNDPSTLVRVFFIVLNLFPSFHFCNAFMNISAVTASNFDSATSLWVKGESYPYSAFFYRVEQNAGATQYSRPAPFTSLIYMLLLGVLYLALMWIFDCLVASNRGFSSNPFSFLWDWYFKMQKKSSAAAGEQDEENNGLSNEEN